MKKLFIIVLVGILIQTGCRQKSQYLKDTGTSHDKELADELMKMEEVDQLAAWNAYPPEGYEDYTLERWKSFKDSIYRIHKVRLEEILVTHGYPGFDLVGESGELSFWLMVQHCDHDPIFQNEVLRQLKIEVDKKNANPRHLGLLTDRVRLNTGEKQIYGTQVTYLEESGQAIPKSLEDSTNVNQRRARLGFEPIEQYLNDMTLAHFEMNRDHFLERGISQPTLYEVSR